MEKDIQDLIETLGPATPEPKPILQKGKTISAFSSNGFETAGDPALEGMLKGCEDFCNLMLTGEEPRWLSLLGPSGSGKTHLSTSVFEWVKKGFRVYQGGHLGITMIRDIMLVDCYEWVKRDASENWNYTPRICEAFFVVIDDLGCARDKTGHLADCYSRIANKRLGKWTIFTSNMLADDIKENVDARVASRLYRNGSTVIETNAPDWNLR